MAVRLFDYFDRVVVINLNRRPERLAGFVRRLKDWPFKWPQRVEAADGNMSRPPEQWTAGRGAWGCQLSHHAVLSAALADGLKNILVLEDDAYPVPDFAQRAAEFLERVPDDWDGMMFGAQHLREPLPVCDGAVRCVASNRTHAYAVRGHFIKTLRDVWGLNKTDHCDLVMSSLMRVFKMYASDPLLIGQDAGESDVTAKKEPLRFLAPAQAQKIAANDPKLVLERLITHVGARPSQNARV
jgi:hypothetical protein